MVVLNLSSFVATRLQTSRMQMLLHIYPIVTRLMHLYTSSDLCAVADVYRYYNTTNVMFDGLQSDFDACFVLPADYLHRKCLLYGNRCTINVNTMKCSKSLVYTAIWYSNSTLIYIGNMTYMINIIGH